MIEKGHATWSKMLIFRKPKPTVPTPWTMFGMGMALFTLAGILDWEYIASSDDHTSKVSALLQISALSFVLIGAVRYIRRNWILDIKRPFQTFLSLVMFVSVTFWMAIGASFPSVVVAHFIAYFYGY
jgi:hypothetical protein